MSASQSGLTRLLQILIYSGGHTTALTPMMALTDKTLKRFYSPVFNFGFGFGNGLVRGTEVLS